MVARVLDVVCLAVLGHANGGGATDARRVVLLAGLCARELQAAP